MSEPLKLMPCPFCGGGETQIIETPLSRSPRMDGKPSPIISVAIQHWCGSEPGQPTRNTVHRIGRDMESAIAALPTREEVLEAVAFHLDSRKVAEAITDAVLALMGKKEEG